MTDHSQIKDSTKNESTESADLTQEVLPLSKLPPDDCHNEFVHAPQPPKSFSAKKHISEKKEGRKAPSSTIKPSKSLTKPKSIRSGKASTKVSKNKWMHPLPSINYNCMFISMSTLNMF